MKSNELEQLLGKRDGTGDLSLHAKSLSRAQSGAVPKTLTAHEWEQWYADHGIPPEHTSPTIKPAPTRWWKKLLNRYHQSSGKL